MATGDLPSELHQWIERTTRGAVTDARRHLAGASRQAWAVDVSRDGSTIELFVMRDNLSGRGGSFRDGAVLRALAETPIPVPVVYGASEELGALILQRMPGRGDFPAVDHEHEREPTARHLMELTAALHRLDPAKLSIPHLDEPVPPDHHAGVQLASVEQVAGLVGDGLHPLFRFALGWLRRHLPRGVERTSLVHSDMGPGNFVFSGGRVTAVLDWEVAHWGDAMEDLAAISVRDMATPVGHLPTRFAEYVAAGGPRLDLARVQWYRVLILVRNSMLIGLGLARDDAAVDRAQLTMFRTLLMRAAALALCDAIGIDRPVEPPFETNIESADDLALVEHASRDLRDTVLPTLNDSFVAQRGAGVAGVMGVLDHRVRFGAEHQRRELDDLAHVLGHRPDSLAAGLAALTPICEVPDRPHDLAAFLARHMLRRGMMYAPLLGPLAERAPQPLEDR